jgi:hypothetical protein
MRVRPRQIVIGYTPAVEIWDANRRTDLFAAAFGREIIIV